jgi:hypothetical protein
VQNWPAYEAGLRRRGSLTLLSRDTKCCDSRLFKSSHLPIVSHFMTALELRPELVVRHEM